MRLGFRRNDAQPPGDPSVGVVIVSGSCCIPSMAPLDEHARRVIEQAIAETGVVARLTVIPATTAYFGGVSKAVMAQLITDFNSGRIGVPAVLVSGTLISRGIPEIEDVKAALLRASGAKTTAEEHADA